MVIRSLCIYERLSLQILKLNEKMENTMMRVGIFAIIRVVFLGFEGVFFPLFLLGFNSLVFLEFFFPRFFKCFFCVFFLMFWVFFEILVGFQVFGVFFFRPSTFLGFLVFLEFGVGATSSVPRLTRVHLLAFW
jgi:hypothetical protein